YLLGAGTYGMCRAIVDRALPRWVAAHGLAVGLGALPAAFYLIGLVSSDPVYRALADDRSTVQGFWFYAIAHTPLLAPALVVAFVPELRRRLLLPLCWVVCVFLFLLTPLRMGGKQARLLGGVHAPLALLAVAGVEHLARAGSRRLRSGRQDGAVAAAMAGYALVLAPAMPSLVVRQSQSYAPRRPDYYIGPELQEVFRRIAAPGGSNEITLGGEYTGGWAPTLAGARVYHGHWHMTLDEPRKKAELTHFFTGDESVEARAAWLRTNRITWVIRYPWEWFGATVPLTGVPGLRPEYVTPDVQLYRFTASEDH
ncbi:MAG: hypothetical protein K0Q72_5482, partial [Armatimonadetes bacterium]|nr:hypothetical protein [Armatimonadota bacterium]